MTLRDDKSAQAPTAIPAVHSMRSIHVSRAGATRATRLLARLFG
jgi:hypothetical protein